MTIRGDKLISNRMTTTAEICNVIISSDEVDSQILSDEIVKCQVMNLTVIQLINLIVIQYWNSSTL